MEATAGKSCTLFNQLTKECSWGCNEVQNKESELARFSGLFKRESLALRTGQF